MKKTLINIYGGAKAGKSSSIIECCRILEEELGAIPDRKLNYNHDILVVLTYKGIKIGIESQGDPNSRMITWETLKGLANTECDIIICASRTSGGTVKKVWEVAHEFDYHVIRMSSIWSNTIKSTLLNRIFAERIVNLVETLLDWEL